MGINSYFLKGVPAPLWQAVKVKAAQNNETIRQVLLRALTRYAHPSKRKAAAGAREA